MKIALIQIDIKKKHTNKVKNSHRIPSSIGYWGGWWRSQRVVLPLHREMAHL